MQKRFPSLEMLQKTFQVTYHEAFHIRGLMKDQVHWSDFESARRRQSFVFDPDERGMYLRMVAINECLDFHGEEGLTVGRGQRQQDLPRYLQKYFGKVVRYLNTGDMYYPTVCIVDREWKIRSVGYWLGEGK